MNDQGRPGLDYPCPTCHLIGLASPLCHTGTDEKPELTPLNALRRIEQHLAPGLSIAAPDVEEALARLWKYLIEGK
jgi:hypothetical protein